MKTYMLVPIFAALLLISPTNGRKSFWRGRYMNGNMEKISSPDGSNRLAIPDEWFNQILDHNDLSNKQTWKQLYYTRSDFYKPGGPVFIMVGGEGPISTKFMEEGAWIHYAKENNALCFQLEHRFYGKSHPTEDLSTTNLAYLSSEQALADLAYFITAMKEKYNLQSNRWVAFGGSYPGSLAAWAREKFPHLIHASVSSSGPLLAKVDFYGKETFEHN
jgi:Serine carboxypeptidase S28